MHNAFEVTTEVQESAQFNDLRRAFAYAPHVHAKIDIKQMISYADILDAVVCLLAGRDFILGEAMAPVNWSLAEIEGWIWTRAPAGN